MRWPNVQLLLAEAFRQRGYLIKEIGGESADMVLLSEEGKYLVDCRHWSALEVGANAAGQLYGAMGRLQAKGGFVVTAGRFTSDALEFARGLNVELIPARDFARMLEMAKETITGAVPGDVPSITTTSACLPVVREPTRSSRPATCAPSSVAVVSMSRAVSASDGNGSSVSQTESFDFQRSWLNAHRISVNMSPGTVVTTSIDRLGRSPCARAFMIGGQPWPICISTCGAIEIVPRLLATRSHSASLK